MKKALAQAKRAGKKGEVPVGAVAVLNNRIVAYGHNQSITKSDPTAHAEVVALRRAAKRLRNYRLPGIIIYVTVEPCAMCAGAMVWARVGAVVYGTRDPNQGACGSLLDLSVQPGLNHHYAVRGGVWEEECRTLLQRFFREKRRKDH